VVRAGTNEEANVPVIAYLALPTALLPAALNGLRERGLPAGSRTAVEKPFGDNLRGARELNALLADALRADVEPAVFRVDHALGMTTVQNLAALRFGNRVLEPPWSAQHIEEPQVLWEETLALEGRAAFYDGAGALKDVMQNHMMQVLCIAAMERPAPAADRSESLFSAQEFRCRKIEFLRFLHEPSAGHVIRSSRWARYTSGRLANRGDPGATAVPDYVDEDGVDPAAPPRHSQRSSSNRPASAGRAPGFGSGQAKPSRSAARGSW
jgi:glucose-6-phosphate 1-dehydrogenase